MRINVSSTTDNITYKTRLFCDNAGIMVQDFTDSTLIEQYRISKYSQSYIKHKTADDGINIDNWNPGDDYGYSVLFGHYALEFTTGTFPAGLSGGNYISVIQYDTGNDSWWKVQELIDYYSGNKYLRFKSSSTGQNIWSEWKIVPVGFESGYINGTTYWYKFGNLVYMVGTITATLSATSNTTLLSNIPVPNRRYDIFRRATTTGYNTIDIVCSVYTSNNIPILSVYGINKDGTRYAGSANIIIDSLCYFTNL